ncbi:helix-turn-helix domain-containing protein [Seongchinamella unica]|uniref:helix-turn-helix domain-containing protein n=1 Tax=Seongchinamella unica TaxID=2547392 RepID=UPI0014044D90|nr:helix-turn-helix transcriptional regulator [Seongchinamella unica]
MFSALAAPLADCIDKLGNAEFYPRFYRMMRIVAAIDQYMVFEFSPSGEHVRCRLAHNAGNPELGVTLASAYVAGGYLNDPLLQQLSEQLVNQSIECSPAVVLEKRTLPAVYRHKFFNLPALDSKFAFVIADQDTRHLFYINFYGRESDHFPSAIQNTLEEVKPVISSLLLKHFREERQSAGLVNSLLQSGLSDREAQICELIKKGHTAKGIALSLCLAESTVVTYKKRAFQKLHVKRKSELAKFA